MRLDLGRRAGVELRVRNLRLRPRNEAERQSFAEREAVRRRKAQAADLVARYLDRPAPANIASVVAGHNEIQVHGKTSGNLGELRLVEAQPWQELWNESALAEPADSAFLPPFQAGAEGDFTVSLPRFDGVRDRLTSRWAVASATPGARPQRLSHFAYVHPYPQSLFHADAWNDALPTDNFDTPLITPKNIAVLDRWMHRPEMLFEGRLRTVLLSEQGFHTPDYSAASQRLQAAAFVYLWRKLRGLKSVEAFHNHRWVDHPREGGLKLGLRTLPADGPYGNPKLSWEIYQALDTPEEASKTAFAREVMGEAAWAEGR
ncbi:MAG TPA: DUF5722 domain-containing protein [Verrucomicrobiales bacterium]|nr:DUF5722 domain-containing protein [Verrucomicrobiales bacterium]